MHGLGATAAPCEPVGGTGSPCCSENEGQVTLDYIDTG